LLRRIWPERGPMTPAELVEHLDANTVRPGWTNAWTAPVRARMDMMSTGVRTPVGLRVVAADPARLDALGAAAEASGDSALALGAYQGCLAIGGRRVEAVRAALEGRPPPCVGLLTALRTAVSPVLISRFEHTAGDDAGGSSVCRTLARVDIEARVAGRDPGS